jgi:hypothetical protein
LGRTTSEERRRAAYGDRTKLGYGYVQEMLSGLPDPELFPITRYRDFTRNLHLLLPGSRRRIDSRMLIGIELSTSDFQEGTIAHARLPRASGDRAAQSGSWAFRTLDDYDTLTGFRLRFAGDPPESVQLTLQESPHSRKILGSWTFRPAHSAAGDAWIISARLKPFSFGRGATDFVLQIRTTPTDKAAPEIVGVEVVGIKVDLANYQIVQREGGCFTAFRKDFLNEMQVSRDAAWRRYLQGLSRDSRQSPPRVEAAAEPGL